MAYTNTTLLGLNQPTTGSESGVWGDDINLGTTILVEVSVAGANNITYDGDVTLSISNGSSGSSFTSTVITSTSTGIAQYYVLNCSGARTAARNIIAPSFSKSYLITNGTTGGYAITIKKTAGTGVSIAAGETCIVYYNTVTADYAKASSNLVTGLTGTLPVANGGTGLTSGTSGGVLAYTASGTLASSGALTANNVVVGGGAGAAPSSTNLLAISAAVTTGNYIKAIGYADTVTALGNTGTAINLDVTSGNVFTATLTGNATITLRYPVATGSSSFTLILTNDATAGRTVAWAGGTFKFPGGSSSLSRTTTANAIDVWFFFTPDGGTTWYGSIPMANLTT